MPDIDETADKHGLPASMRIPIAAKSLEAITRFVGPILQSFGKVPSHDNAVGAVLVDTSHRPQKDGARLWGHPDIKAFEARLFPPRQVWVHVDYEGYRDAYKKLGMPEIKRGDVLDHVQNRKAIRDRDYSHPYILLCPISSQVNTNAGVDSGAEGIERAHLETAHERSEAIQQAIKRGNRQQVIYADPADLTKMLDIAPGTKTLPGVGGMLLQFYA